MAIGSLCVLLSMFKLNADVFAETNIRDDVKESIEVYENLDDLPMDLLEELRGIDPF